MSRHNRTVGFCRQRRGSGLVPWYQLGGSLVPGGCWGGLTRPQLLPEPCAMVGPLSAYPVPPDCLAAAGVVDRPAYGLADRKTLDAPLKAAAQ